MNEATIGRNYAEALLALARKDDEIEEYGQLLNAIATAMNDDQTLRTFLDSPKLAASHKIEILEKAFGRRMPRLFLRYVETVIQKRRQMLIPEIAAEYQTLLDQAENRLIPSPARTSNSIIRKTRPTPAGTGTLRSS